MFGRKNTHACEYNAPMLRQTNKCKYYNNTFHHSRLNVAIHLMTNPQHHQHRKNKKDRMEAEVASSACHL